MPKTTMTKEAKDYIQDCLDCYRVCTETLGHCLKMGGKHLEESHLRLLQDCAYICKMSADFMIRGSDSEADLCRVCADICASCAKSCENIDTSDEMMARCADACKKCASSCKEMGSK